MSEPDVTNLMTVQQAIALLDAAPITPRARIHRLPLARGMRLASDLHADREYPPFAKSLMDGFAIPLPQAEKDSAFELAGEIRAGQVSYQPLSPGEAIAIMTGAPLPPGAAGVVPIEFATQNANRIQTTQGSDFSRFVSARGSECRAGETVLQKGTLLGPAQLALAATIGASEVNVFDRPRVAILATGDELVEIQETPQPHQIRNANSILLESLLTGYGCEVTDLGTVKDDMPALLKAIRAGLDFDALFITGGMSVGKYDLPPAALKQLQADICITKLKIKPGKPFIYARLNGSQIFGLPGNPLAGFVCTVRLASRLLRRLAGATMIADELTARLAMPLPANGPREFYQPVVFDGTAATALSWKSSADVFTLARCNALLVRPENDPAQPAGAACQLILFPEAR